MPIFEYICPACGKKAEEFVKDYHETVLCPVCGTKMQREWADTVYSATGKPKKNCSGNCSTCSGCK